MDELVTCHFVEQHTSLIIQDYPSPGKTYLSCAFAKEAYKKHYKTAYIRMSDLLSTEEEARMLGISEEKRLLRKYSQYQALVIDEWLTTGVDADEVRFLYELSERRFDSASTIFATLHDKGEWLACLGDGALSVPIIERFTNNVIVLNIGENDFRAVFEHRDPPSLGSFGATAT